MISRSSSSYQPLDKGNKGRDSRRSSLGRDVEGQGHEMTSIAVISSGGPGGSGANPLRAGAGTTVSTITQPAHRPHHDLDFTKYKSDGEKTSWTNFHFVMCIGIVGFFVFWIFLLAKMYLPPEFQIGVLISKLFALFNSSDGADDAGAVIDDGGLNSTETAVTTGESLFEDSY